MTIKLVVIFFLTRCVKSVIMSVPSGFDFYAELIAINNPKSLYSYDKKYDVENFARLIIDTFVPMYAEDL